MPIFLSMELIASQTDGRVQLKDEVLKYVARVRKGKLDIQQQAKNTCKNMSERQQIGDQHPKVHMTEANMGNKGKAMKRKMTGEQKPFIFKKKSCAMKQKR